MESTNKKQGSFIISLSHQRPGEGNFHGIEGNVAFERFVVEDTPPLKKIAVDSSFDEYLVNVYGVAEDWFGFSQAHQRLAKSQPKIAEILLNQYVKKDKLKKQITDGMVSVYQKNGWSSTILGTRKECPPPTSNLMKHCQQARVLLETKQWSTLEDLILKDILPDPEFKQTMLGRRIVIAGGLAILDFKNKYPNCIAPWPVDKDGRSNFSVEAKAKIIATIIKLRNKQYQIAKSLEACKVIEISNDRSLCVRVLVAGGYARAYELLHQVTDPDELTLVTACHLLEYQGPKAAQRYYEANLPQLTSIRAKEFIGEINPILKDLEGWHEAVKQLSFVCPSRLAELPIARRILKNTNNQPTQAQIRNLERMFWVLQAAQYREKAREMLDRLSLALKPILERIKKKTTKDKIQQALDGMLQAWETTKTIPMDHVANLPASVSVQQLLDYLVEGNIVGALEMRKTLFKELAKSGKANVLENSSYRFFTLIIAAFRNPQLLNPPTVHVLRGDDWEYNWYVANAVDSYIQGEKFIELVNDQVPQKWFEAAQGLIFFFAGRFNEVSMLAKQNETVREMLGSAAQLCGRTRDDICSQYQSSSKGLPGSLKKFSQEEMVNPPELAKLLPDVICPALIKARNSRAVHAQVFRLSANGIKTLSTLGAETYLQPPLPSEIPSTPRDSLIEIKVLAPPPTLDVEQKEKDRIEREKMEIAVKEAEKAQRKIQEEHWRKQKSYRKQTKASMWNREDALPHKTDKPTTSSSQLISSEEESTISESYLPREKPSLKSIKDQPTSRKESKAKRWGEISLSQLAESERELGILEDLRDAIQVIGSSEGMDRFIYPSDRFCGLKGVAQSFLRLDDRLRSLVYEESGLTLKDLATFEEFCRLSLQIRVDFRTFEVDPQSKKGVLKGLEAYESFLLRQLPDHREHSSPKNILRITKTAREL